jgi:stage III sporulation protein AH
VKNLRRNIVVVTVLLFVCAAVYLNWSYNNRWGDADSAMVEAEDEAMAQAGTTSKTPAPTGDDTDKETTQEDAQDTAENTGDVSDYFAAARLSRQQSRDEALGLLETAAYSETATAEAASAAMEEITTMASWSVEEAQIENMLLAKDFTECVVFMSEDSVTVAVPSPLEGLSEAAVARITDTILAETNYTAEQLKIIEVKDE